MKKNLLILVAVAALVALGFVGNDAIAQGGVQGGVIDAEGNAVPGATVVLHQIGRERGQRPYRAQVETDRAGRFNFGRVPVGNYNIMAGAEDLGRACDEIVVRQGQITRVCLQLQGRGGDDERGVGAIVGIVLTPNGDPYTNGALIVLQPMQRQRGERHRQLTTRSDRDGRFYFVNIPEGRYIIQALVRGGMAVARIEVIADRRNQVRLVLQRVERGERGVRERQQHRD